MRAMSRGFSPIEVIIVIAVIATIGGLGYVAYNSFSSKQPKADANASTAQSTSDEAAPVKVESTKDLDTVTAQLDEVAIDDSDTDSFDEAVDGF